MKNHFKKYGKIYLIVYLLTPHLWIVSLPFIILALPLYLTWKNVKQFHTLIHNQAEEGSFWINDGLIFFFGTLLTLLAFSMLNIVYLDWPETLVNNQLHSPIHTKAWGGQFILLILGLVSYLVLHLYKGKFLPPLLTVLLISCLYPSFVFSSFWIFQLSSLIKTDLFTYFYLCLFPLNVCLIYSRTIYQTIKLWQEQLAKHPNPTFPRLSLLLQQSFSLPVWLLLFAIPYISILGIYLIVFGQQPDQLIQMWTETSDWALSEKISPPNTFYDEHYLCTVGAAGHRRLVKPIRMGQRHGHRVVVNRQLQIANAFEQILEERCPDFHQAIRFVYDRYGYPISKHIQKPWQADLIYLAMKPAEYIFLLTIYLYDVQPENRISLQYFPKETIQKSEAPHPIP